MGRRPVGHLRPLTLHASRPTVEPILELLIRLEQSSRVARAENRPSRGPTGPAVLASCCEPLRQADFSYRVELALVGGHPLIRPPVGAAMRKGLRSDLERLRVLLELGDASASDGRGPDA